MESSRNETACFSVFNKLARKKAANSGRFSRNTVYTCDYPWVIHLKGHTLEAAETIDLGNIWVKKWPFWPLHPVPVTPGYSPPRRVSLTTLAPNSCPHEGQFDNLHKIEMKIRSVLAPVSPFVLHSPAENLLYPQPAFISSTSWKTPTPKTRNSLES